jgi:hypothetical protein
MSRMRSRVRPMAEANALRGQAIQDIWEGHDEA